MVRGKDNNTSQMNRGKFFENKTANSSYLKDKMNDSKLNEISKIEQFKESKLDELRDEEINHIIIDENTKNNIYLEDTKEVEKKIINDEDDTFEFNKKLSTYLKNDVGFFKSLKIEKYDKITQYYEEMKRTIIVPEEEGDDEQNECAINNKEYDKILEKEHSI